MFKRVYFITALVLLACLLAIFAGRAEAQVPDCYGGPCPTWTPTATLTATATATFTSTPLPAATATAMPAPTQLVAPTPAPTEAPWYALFLPFIRADCTWPWGICINGPLEK